MTHSHAAAERGIGIRFGIGVAVVAVAVAALALSAAFGAGAAWANPGSLDSLKGTIYLAHWKDDYPISYASGSTGEISDAKSSNTKVATVQAVAGDSSNGGMAMLSVTKKKAGTTKVSFNLAGKKRAFTLKVFKYSNPVKQFKVGQKNYASKLKDSPYYNRSMQEGATPLSGKVKVKAASGWKLGEIYVYTATGTKAVANGYKIKASESLGYVTMKNKKTGAVQDLAIY